VGARPARARRSARRHRSAHGRRRALCARGAARAVAAATGREAIGLEAAELLPWGRFDVLEYVVGTSDEAPDETKAMAARRRSPGARARRLLRTCELRAVGPAVRSVRGRRRGCSSRARRRRSP
jgi:hypothetical protein